MEILTYIQWYHRSLVECQRVLLMVRGLVKKSLISKLVWISVKIWQEVVKIGIFVFLLK
jgi:hypothetical protein